MTPRRIPKFMAIGVASLALLLGSSGAAQALDTPKLPIDTTRPCVPTDYVGEAGGSNIVEGTQGLYDTTAKVLTFTFVLEARACVGLTYQVEVYANRPGIGAPPVQDGDATIATGTATEDPTSNRLTTTVNLPGSYSDSRLLVVARTIDPMGHTIDRAPDDGAVQVCDPESPCNQKYY